MTTNSGPPDAIVLIHGLWMTPRSCEQWIPRYESRGLRVLAPAYPGFEVEVEALRADPSPIAKLTIGEVADHYDAIIRGSPQPRLRPQRGQLGEAAEADN